MSFSLRPAVTQRAQNLYNFWLNARFPGKRWVQLVWRALLEMGNDDATHLAAGIAYYSMFSIFPLLLATLAVSGSVLAFGSLQVDFTKFVTDNLPGSGDIVEQNLDQVIRFRGLLGAVGFVGLIWSASTVFGAVARSVNRAWNIHQDRPFYISKVQHLGMSILIGILFVLSAVATSIIELFAHQSRYLGILGLNLILNLGLGIIALRLIPWGLSVAIFLLIYRVAPNTKTYWKYVWPGAVVAAVLFEICKGAFVWYVENLATHSVIYGSLTSVMALMLWIYLSSLAMILGAEISSEYSRIRMGAARRGPWTRMPESDDWGIAGISPGVDLRE